LKKQKTLLKIIERIINTGHPPPKHLNIVFDTIIIMTTKSVVKNSKSKKLKEPMIDYYPTGSDVFLVEDILNSSEDSAMKMSDLEKALPKEITKNKLKQILIYLEKINRILIDKKRKRILYIYNDSPKLRDVIKKGVVYG